MNWQSYIRESISSLDSLYDAEESFAILKKMAEYLSGQNYVAISKDVISEEHRNKSAYFLNQLTTGKPIQYVLGEAWFYKYPYKVNPSVLIPRPETEELVEWALQTLNDEYPNKKARILDVGTGSGCIPITLKKERPGDDITSIDISAAALITAQTNAALLQADITFQQLNFLEKDSREKLPSFDLIISNPPYIPLDEKDTLSQTVTAYEPHEALFIPSANPLLFYECIAEFGLTHLTTNGMIFLELHQDYALATEQLLKEHGYREVMLQKDISGNNRMLCAKK